MSEHNDRQKLLDRISVDPSVMVGKPVVRGTRMPVYLVVQMLGSGIPVEEILADHPGLTAEDVRACLLFAADAVEASAALRAHAAAH